MPCGRQGFEMIPGRVMSSRQGFADASGAMAQTDITVLSAGITKFSEAAVFAGDEKRPAAIHYGSVLEREPEPAWFPEPVIVLVPAIPGEDRVRRQRSACGHAASHAVHCVVDPEHA